MTSKNTKRALLTSALSILMCVSMLIGTTFAWFTDTATTNVNKIQAGTLDVALEMWNGTEWVNAEGETLNFKAADGRTDILWEPGCTYELPALRIKNNGNLALKYQVVISGINGDAQLNEAIDWYYSVELTAFGGYGWTSLTPDYKLSNFTTDEKYLYPQAIATIARPNESVFKIVGKMKETAGNEYQGLSIDGVSITVVATQYNYESDSYGKTYDENAAYPDVWDGKTATAPEMTDGVYHITTAAEFAQYINELNNSPSTGAHRYDMAKAVLDADIDLAGAVLTVSGEGYMFSGSFDGNGHTVSNFTVKRTDEALYTGLFSVYMYGGTIKNLTVKNATVDSNGNQVAAVVPSVNADENVASTLVENCHAIDCVVNGAKKVGAVVGYAASRSHAIVKDCSAKDCTVTTTKGEANVTIFGYNNGATFEGNVDNGGNTLSYGE